MAALPKPSQCYSAALPQTLKTLSALMFLFRMPQQPYSTFTLSNQQYETMTQATKL